ncbi:GlcG/HbpS family heme-binding protein [Escherichia coli]|uniref:GlcG/HbpS family heme-binding protein n=1 Tax=Escherichia coli TaxID=562 RepID=UPI003D1BCE43
MKKCHGGGLMLTQHSISLAGARNAIRVAQQKAHEKGWHITVAVVDRAGELVALERDDAGIGISPVVAAGKARTAALLRAPSGDFENFINGGQPSFLATPGVIPLEGGIPLLFENEVIGAVGVSGAHGASDTLVAQAAASAFTKEKE